MKKILVFFMSVALLAAGSCKKGIKNDYVDLLPGKWTVAGISPDVPETAYIVSGDVIEIKSDLSYTLDNHWGPVFTEKIWTLTFDPQDASSYLCLYGISNEKQYVLLVGRITGMTQSDMYLEYKDEKNTLYRYVFRRVE